MYKFLKKNKTMLLALTIIVILFPCIVLIPSPIGIIPYETGLTIVGYGDSILGGFLTLYGVWWTIEDNKRQKNEEISIQYRPIIKVLNKKLIFIPHPKQKNDYFEDSYFMIEAEIEFQNIGRGEISHGEIIAKKQDKYLNINYKKHFDTIFPDEKMSFKFESKVYNYDLIVCNGANLFFSIDINVYDFANNIHRGYFDVSIIVEPENGYYYEGMEEPVTYPGDIYEEIGDFKRLPPIINSIENLK